MAAQRIDFSALATNVVKQVFTAADGETYAIGRILGVILLAFGLIVPSGAALFLIFTVGITWTDFDNALDKLAFYVPALVGSVVALITLTNPTEPKPINTPTPPARQAPSTVGDDSGSARPV